MRTVRVIDPMHNSLVMRSHAGIQSDRSMSSYDSDDYSASDLRAQMMMTIPFRKSGILSDGNGTTTCG